MFTIASIKRVTVRNRTRGDVIGTISSDEGDQQFELGPDAECMCPVGEIITLQRTHYDSDEPIPVNIYCPKCGTLHVDEGKFATKRHHTHTCQACGLTWRTAIVNTVGVRFLPGFKNEGGP